MDSHIQESVKGLLVARQYLLSVVFDSAVDGATMHLLCVAPIYRA